MQLKHSPEPACLPWSWPWESVDINELLEVLYIDEALASPEPVDIGIFDDVLTNGTHYRAIHSILSQRFPNARIVGFFIARTVHPDPFEDFNLNF